MKDNNLSEMISSVQLGKKGRVFTQVPPEVLTTISEQAIFQVNHFYRRSHLLMLHRILNDRAASDNDRYVAKELLNNAEVAAQGVLPSCQDTGTAVVLAKRGFHVPAMSPAYIMVGSFLQKETDSHVHRSRTTEIDSSADGYYI